MHSESSSEAQDLAIYVCFALRELGAYVRNEAVTTDSIYIKFEKARIGSLRISDHGGRPKYAYRWNLIRGRSGREVDRGVLRRYYDWTEVEEMIADMKRVAHNKRIGLA